MQSRKNPLASNAKAATHKLQVTVDQTIDRVLDEMAARGINGSTRSEVACFILRGWMWDNEEKLLRQGVALAGGSGSAKVGR